MNKNSIIKGTLLMILVSCLTLLVGFSFNRENKLPSQYYQVYLNGKVVGVINSKKELLNLIDKEQNALKNKYKVKKIYPPKGLKIEKILTYRGNPSSVEYIYNKIKNKEPFTIEGYVITIKKEDKNITINTLDINNFKKAINNTVKSFVEEEKYQKYIESNQEKIKDIGSRIDDIDIKEDITIKKSYLSTSDEIFTDTAELSRYLLFGTMEQQNEHIVTINDSLGIIAEANNLNVDELLIVNPEIKGKNALLFPGQKINIGLINPLINVSVVSEIVENQEVKYKTDVKYDYKMEVGTTQVEQKGENGVNKVTYSQEAINGQVTKLVITKSEEIIPMIKQIVKKGEKYSYSPVITSGEFGWPTVYPYVITSRYGMRWGRLHDGIDISGCGHGSPIYSVQSGIVVKSTYSNAGLGNHVYIKHDNGYYSNYGHLSKIYVKLGQRVTKGQIVGTMGNTGHSFGTHLHFGLYTGGEPHNGGTSFNPLKAY